MDAGWPLRLLFGAALALIMSRRGLRRRSLSPSGAAAAFFVGVAAMQASFTSGSILILFYLTSSKLTKLQQERKQRLEKSFKADGQRDAAQVLSNSLGGIVAAVAAQLSPLILGEGLRAEAVRWAATVAFLAHYSCVCADTWASEIGILSSHPPRLVLRPGCIVPPGTNGGVTPLGCASGAAAGAFIGASFWALGGLFGDAMLEPPPAAGGGPPGPAAGPALGGRGPGGGPLCRLLPQRPEGPAGGLLLWTAAGLVCGAAGSFLDSVLGATVQFSGVDESSGKVVGRPGPGVRRVSGRPLLNNDAVNAVAAALTSLGAAAAAYRSLSCGA